MRILKSHRRKSRRHICLLYTSEITLPSSKPNVQEILWKSLEIRNLETKAGQDGVKLDVYKRQALHGENGENGKIQAAFDLFGIKYTGTGYLDVYKRQVQTCGSFYF